MSANLIILFPRISDRIRQLSIEKLIDKDFAFRGNISSNNTSRWYSSFSFFYGLRFRNNLSNKYRDPVFILLETIKKSWLHNFVIHLKRLRIQGRLTHDSDLDIFLIPSIKKWNVWHELLFINIKLISWSCY